MTRSGIDAYLGGFSVPISDENDPVNSKRVYVENTLKDVDGITIMNIAKDLQLFFADVVETEITEMLNIPINAFYWHLIVHGRHCMQVGISPC